MEVGVTVEMEISGRPFAICYYVGPGGLWWTNVLNSALPPQRLRPDTQPEHQDPVSHLAASAEGSPAEVGGSCRSPQGERHWEQKFCEVLLGTSPPRVRH